MADTRVRNPYIAVEIKDLGLKSFRASLCEALQKHGVGAEDSSNSMHLSVAYAEGEMELTEIAALANSIAQSPFLVQVCGFEILRGETTPYDYLALSIESEGCFEDALKAIEGRITTRAFCGGFRSHVSLVRFKKGTLSQGVAESLVRELNASQRAALALGRSISLEGDCVRVYDLDRQCCCDVPFESKPRSSSSMVA